MVEVEPLRFEAMVTEALDGLIRARWILPEDRDAFLTHAKEEWSVATK